MPPAPRPGPCDASPTGLSASPPKSVTSKRGSPTPSIPARPGSPNATASAPTAPPPCSSPPATPRTAPQPSILRRAVRLQPGPGLLRQAPTPPPQPRRRPASQRRPVSHRLVPPPLGPPTRGSVDRRIAQGTPPAKRSAASSATSPARSTRSSSSPDQPQPGSPQPLDIHRGIKPKRRYHRTASTITSPADADDAYSSFRPHAPTPAATAPVRVVQWRSSRRLLRGGLYR